uniref:Ion transport domain-containing protein n=1 Tax=Graphocephala atropunctata TaxID=36148 RepID=A0A1B6KZ14_9HEMI
MSGGMELSEKALHRESSLCSPDPHQQLLTAFQDRDLVTFQNILNQGVRDAYIDPNNWFEDPHYGTLLDLACRSPNNSQYVHALLQSGADPNKINRVRKKSPLHFAIDSKDIQSFELVLNDPRTNPNILDNKGNPPIHSAAELQNSEFLVKLLNHPKINVNMVNKKGQTALHIAAHQENEEAALLLVMAGIDLDSVKNVAGKTGRDLVSSNLPELEKKLPTGNVSKMENGSPNDLFNMLHRRDTETFLAAVRVQDKSNLDNNDGSHTYLQYACDFGLNKIVETMLREGANPNATNPSNIRTPLMLAGYRGYVHIIRLFINNDNTQYTPVGSENVLHSVINGMSDNQLPLGASKENRDHFKCLELLLKDVPRSKLDINCGDVKGNTPLHYAAKHGDPSVILLLLRHGAYVGQRNTLGQPAFADINPKILESYFDECLTTNDKLPREDNFQIVFKYNFLAPPKVPMKPLTSSHVTLQLESGHSDIVTSENTSETDPLLYMSRSSDFRPLLKHPVLTSFVYLKWHRIQRYFFFNLTFYAIFWALLTWYILGIYGAQKTPVENGAQSNVSRAQRDLMEDESSHNSLAEPLRVLVTIFLIILIAREIFQLAISPIKYICNPENWLEIALIGATISILFGSRTAQQQISAVAILLSWAELILLIGRHPANSTNIEMLKTVSWNFLKFLAWYSILIIAFALSFYTLFRDSEDSEDNFFLDPAMSIFKTVVMLTGEFDAGSIPFVAHPGVSHILFVIFVFLIAIVLFNLLNGLAVSDTQAIRADAELVGYVSQVKLVSYIETMALGDPTPFKDLIAKLKTLCCFVPEIDCCSTQFGCLRMFSRKIALLSELSPDYEIRVLPNQENRVEAFGSGHRRKRQQIREDETTCVERCSIVTMDPTIVKAAREILSRRAEDDIYRLHNKSDDDRDRLLVEYGKRLDRYRDQLEAVRKSSEKTQVMMQQLLDFVVKKDKGHLRSSFDDD